MKITAQEKQLILKRRQVKAGFNPETIATNAANAAWKAYIVIMKKVGLKYTMTPNDKKDRDMYENIYKTALNSLKGLTF